MQYEPLSRRPVRRFLPESDDIFRAQPDRPPPGAWEDGDQGDELLFCEGRPVARVLCRDRLWLWHVVGSPRPPMRAGSRAEARQLALFYARRTCG
ncbi:hypothetical protein EZH22_17675 [Xanthobacter dioxanivorans]|uniref:Uncharacterized protein n=1 Tax=Xanthobacter dioxanivorans TaxID=2528964 RepID=A0A974PKG9_9HYPH|nr:hypothetical protein [Xanthobacter dioxanivorans]QRG04956.1 hypothetical protein EZH22_17675 [Xanthobacter dioxanivorans]